MSNCTNSQIETVSVVGTGLIGASWTALFLSKGLTVRASDPAPHAEERLRRFVERAMTDLQRLEPSGVASDANLFFIKDPRDAVEDADLIQENAPEQLDLKRELLATLDGAAKPAAVIASSTSSLRASDLQTACKTPERVVVAHPFNPPHLIPLVEVVGGELTSDETVDRAMAFYRSIGKAPIQVRREVVGHVANRLTAALWREAVYLVAEGIATVADVDKVVVNGPGLRWAALGPNLLYHLGGGTGGMAAYLEHLGPTQEERWKTLGNPQLSQEVKALLIEGVQEAATGRSIEALARERDQMLMTILSARAHGRMDKGSD